MNRNRIHWTFLLVGVVLVCELVLAQATTPRALSTVDRAFEKFWAAASPEEAIKTADDVVRTGVTFEDAFSRLRAGRTYAAQMSGVVTVMNKTKNGVEHYYSVNVPKGYEPAKRYQVRFQLHGGVGGRINNQPRGSGEIGQLAGAEQIYVLPYSWQDSPWWSDDQVLNLNTIVDSLKRTYNIDENRVVVAGVSDGGTGAYYLAMRDTTAWASFLPLNGFIMVLTNQDIDDGRSFPSNLRNKPFFVVNGGQDRLYPISMVEPYTTHLIRNGVSMEYHPQPDGQHNTAWWPEIKTPFEQFVRAHPRDPYPDTLTWTTADMTHNRAHWLVIEETGFRRNETTNLPDANVAGSVSLFSQARNAGRVDLVRTGNTVDATAKSVGVFRLLLSPDEFDFRQPVKVVVNGKTEFDGRVERSLKTLLQWAARDNDRTMLFGAELRIKVP